MVNGLGLAVLNPSATIGAVSSPGAKAGGTVLQVLDLIDKTDVTGSFDLYISADNTVVQLDTSPVPGNSHLVVFQVAGESAGGMKLSIVRSLGAGTGVTGSVTSVGVKEGDIIERAICFPVNHAHDPSDVTLDFAPTAPSDGTLTQINGIPSLSLSGNFDVILLIRPPGSVPADIDISASIGNANNSQSLIGIKAGARIHVALDMSNVTDITSSYSPFACGDDLIVGYYTPQSNIVFLFDKPSS